MPADGLALFDTPIGACGVAWSERGLVELALPHGNPDALRQRLARRHAAASERTPPAAVQQAIDRIVALLHGGHDDLADLALDLAGVPDFHRRVYALARTVGPGTTCSYGELARRLGEPDAARAVGHALGRNPFAIVVPCHRVLAANGRAGGFSAPGGVRTKLHLLEIERALGGLFEDA